MTESPLWRRQLAEALLGAKMDGTGYAATVAAMDAIAAALPGTPLDVRLDVDCAIHHPFVVIGSTADSRWVGLSMSITLMGWFVSLNSAVNIDIPWVFSFEELPNMVERIRGFLTRGDSERD